MIPYAEHQIEQIVSAMKNINDKMKESPIIVDIIRQRLLCVKAFLGDAKFDQLMRGELPINKL